MDNSLSNGLGVASRIGPFNTELTSLQKPFAKNDTVSGPQKAKVNILD